MEINQLLSDCTHDNVLDLELLTAILFDAEDQLKILEQIKAT